MKNDNQDGVKDGAIPQNLPGVTRAYASDALPVIDEADDDETLGDCHLLHAIDVASTQNMGILVVRTAPKSIRVHLRGSANNPLIAGAPSIDWNVVLDIDSSTPPPNWRLQGVEDGFPAFEIYINKVAIYRRNAPPPYRIADLMKLRPRVGDVQLNLSGFL